MRFIQFLNSLFWIICCLLWLSPSAQALVLPRTKADSIVENKKVAYLKEIENAKDSLQKISTLYDYGVFLDEEGVFEQSVIQLNNALRIANTISNHKIITKITNYLGGMYWSSGDCETSTNYFEQALQSAEIIEDDDLVAMVKMNLSGNYNSSGDANKAIEYSLAALEIKEKNGNMEDICFDYVTVGEIFQNTGNVEKWKFYIQKAYDLKDDKNCAKMTDLVMIYNNLGTIAEAEKKYDQSLAYYDTMMMVSKTNDYYEGMGISRLNSALIYQLLEKPQKALQLTNESMLYLGDVPYFVMAVNNVQAELLQELGRNTKALELVTETLNNEELDYYPSLKQQCLSLLYTLNFQLGNYQDAFNWNDTLKFYEKKLHEEENLKAVEELETKYQTEKKEQQIELLSAENQLKNQRIRVGIILLSVLFIVILLILYILQIRRKQAVFVQNDLRQQVLRSQMNPHFIFNVLGSIQNYMLTNNPKKAAGYLSQFASLTRATLEYSSEDTIALSDEIAMLRNYMELEQMRKPGIFGFAIEYDDELESDFIHVPPMMIQPFVENAIKHGFKNINYVGKLQLLFVDKMEYVEVVIQDNGVGIENKNEINQQHRSMAMEIFEKRRKLIQHKFNKDFTFDISNLKTLNPETSGVKVTLQIPVLDND